ncbi:protein kinase domain-containing protein [Sorangium sp. So ce887]|uniref:protein kinase domain-containing protein n=1 Tax=Sorangium sp. So ce887 TaxID=3133324 RepID=UPI003F6389C2
MAYEDLRRRADELAAIGQRERGAALLVAAGDRAGASELLERVCDFAGAAREALAAEDPARAALMAALGGDDALAREALDELSITAPRDAALRVAADLAARGFPRHAGALFAALGAHAAAAEAFTAAQDARRAAESFELAGRPADGARVLEAALRRRPGDAAAWLALGELLARHGRTEAAVRALQHLPPTSAERARALPLLCRCLGDLGLEDAAQTVRDELSRLDPRGQEALSSPAVVPGGPAAAPSPAGAAPAGPLLFGRYETLRDVTATHHARVVEARDRITAERVAVKIFAGAAFGAGRDALLRFEREARALAQLRHPNVVALRAYHPEGPAMVLAWMAGGSLIERLRGEPVAPARAVEIACALLSALGEAHRLGILHRDVKPSNVLFDEIGTAHLADFGAAHLGDLSTTATAGAIGTFAYMSPEQRMGRPATLASDLYGAGAVLAELLTGEPPAPAVGGHLDPAPSEIHPDLTAAHDAIVAALLAEDPAARPADAFEARRAITALPWPESPRPRRSRASARPRSSEAPPSATTRLAATLEVGDGRDTEGRWRDAWLDRDVLVLQLDDATLARARAFARAGHPALPSVLRVDLAAGEVWVAPPQGRALADEGRALTRGQRARLGEAIAALHGAGGAHGCIDGQHLYLHDGEIALAYPREAAGGVEELAARDLAALEELDRNALDEP